MRACPLAQGSGDGASPQRVQGSALAAAEPSTCAWLRRDKGASKKGRLNLRVVVGGIGENKASAETERGAGGFQGVAAGGDVVHEIGLAERQGVRGTGQVVPVGRDRTKSMHVAGALGLNRSGAEDGFDNLSAGQCKAIMLDYYGLPADFPGMDSRPSGDPLLRVRHVEAALKAHFDGEQDFLPYLSLHGFEALLFASTDELPRALTAPAKAVEFAAIRAGFKTPEDINERPRQTPSYRIGAIFPAYRKKFHGPTTARRIGLDTLRGECPHFNEWITALELFARRN